jgi:polysaccharide biosynthesis protein PslG
MAPARPWLRLLMVAAACAAALLLTAAFGAGRADAATVPQGMVGMNDWAPPTDQAVESMSRAGIKRWRAPLFWYLVEKEPQQRDWSDYDRLAATSARQGASLLFVIASCPSWACNDISGPPVTGDGLAAHHDFVRAAVARYGDNGSFWRSHPELPYAPVRDWQVWNEVNSAEFWKPGPSAADYARFLRDESAVIRATDPAATVVLSGLTNYGQVPLETYLRQLYAQPGFRDSFDVVALHAYAGDTRAVSKLLDGARRVMVDAGDAARPAWITEMGWGTSTPTFQAPTTPSRQAELLRSTYDTLIGCRGRWNLQRAYWFAYRDIDPPPGQPDYAGYHTGLIDTAGRQKPAWATMLEYPEGGQLPGGRGASCPFGSPHADTAAPNTAILAPRRPASGRKAKVRLLASERKVRFQCRLVRAGKRRARRGARGWRRCPRRYTTPHLRRGRYRLEVRAIDAHRNADRSPALARIVRRRSARLRIRVLRPGRSVAARLR